MNLKFNLNIKDIDIKILDLGNKNLENDITEYLAKIQFNKLKVFNFVKNKISDIRELENASFTRLEILDLSVNNISNIDILEKVNFKELKILGLLKNIISDISVLEKVKFKKLEYRKRRVKSPTLKSQTSKNSLFKLLFSKFNSLISISFIFKLNF